MLTSEGRRRFGGKFCSVSVSASVSSGAGDQVVWIISDTTDCTCGIMNTEFMLIALNAAGFRIMQPFTFFVTRRRCCIARLYFALCLGFGVWVQSGAAQGNGPSPDEKYPENPTRQESVPSRPARLGRLPIEWIIGPYVPAQGRLEPLSNAQRKQIYFRQTFLTAGSYVARAFSAGIDQASGEPHEWGGGFAGYGRRYAARYGEFVIQNTVFAGGNAVLGLEPRYDFCRCEGFWPRTRHAISRNFVAYNRSERELRPQIPMYAGAFTAGLLYDTWLPEHHNVWEGGAYNVLSQAGIGSGYNFVSEFALDILHAFGFKKNVQRLP
jgi:hypothetical protein